MPPQLVEVYHVRQATRADVVRKIDWGVEHPDGL